MAADYNVAIRLKAAVDGLKEVQGLIEEIEDLGGTTTQASAQSQALAAELQDLQDTDGLISQFRELKQSVGATGEELADAQQRAQALGRELAQTDNPTKALRESFSRARAAVNRLQEAEQDQIRTLDGVRQSLTAAGISTDNLAESQGELRRRMAAAEQEAEDLTEELVKLRAVAAHDIPDPTESLRRGINKSREAVLSLGQRMGDLLKRFGPLIAAIGALGAAATAAAAAFASLFAAGYLEQMRLQVRAVSDSTKEAKDAFARLLRITRRTPAEIKDLTKVYTILKRRGLEPTTEAMLALIRANVRAGGKQTDLINLTQALGEAYAKQKIEVSTLNQLAERGIPAWQTLAQAMGVTVTQLEEMAKAGKLGRQEIHLLIQEINQASTGALERHMNSLKGLVTTLGEQFLKFGNLVAKSGLMEFAKQQLRDLINLFREAARSGALQKWAQRISDALVTFLSAIRSTIEALYRMREALAIAGKALLALGVAKVLGYFAGLASLLRGKMIRALGVFSAATAAASSRMAGLAAVIRKIPGSIKVAIVVLGLALVKKAAEIVGELYVRLSGLQNEVEQNRQRLLSIQKRTLAAARKHMRTFAEYRNTVVRTTSAVVKLSETERKRYAKSLKGLLEYKRGQRTLIAQLQEMGIAHEKTTAQITRDIKKIKQALDDLPKAYAIVARAIQNDVGVAVQLIVERFHKMRDAGKSAGAAIKTIFQGFDLTKLASVEKMVQVIRVLSEQSTAAARAIREHLRKQLQQMTANDVIRFQTVFKAALQQIGNKSRHVAGVLNQTLGRALNILGVDIHKLKTGITSAAQKMITSLRAVVESGAANAKQLEAAFKAAASAIQTKAGIQAMKALAKQAVETYGAAAAGLMEIVNSITIGIENTADKAKKELETVKQKAKEVANATREMVQKTQTGMERIAGVAAALVQIYESTAARAREASRATAELFRSLVAGRVVLEKTTSTIEQLKTEIRNLQAEAIANFGGLGLTGYINRLNRSLAISLKRFKQDQLAALKLTQALKFVGEVGGRSLSRIIRKGREAIKSMDLLGKQRLSQLRAAIANATRRLQNLRRTATSTLRAVRAELASLQEDYTELAQIRAERRTRRIEAQLGKARRLGDRESIIKLEQALSVAREIAAIQMQQAREREAEARRERQRQQRQQPQQPQPIQMPTRHVEITLRTPTGQDVELQADDTNLQNLIALLEQQGMRAQ